jgi:hypothetical protein
MTTLPRMMAVSARLAISSESRNVAAVSRFFLTVAPGAMTCALVYELLASNAAL